MCPYRAFNKIFPYSYPLQQQISNVEGNRGINSNIKYNLSSPSVVVVSLRPILSIDFVLDDGVKSCMKRLTLS